ncbi:MAG: c-type cytochrome [Planctomycetota bacterium]|nr:c-type cytochrome [Planctomycetota bacterium]
MRLTVSLLAVTILWGLSWMGRPLRVVDGSEKSTRPDDAEAVLARGKAFYDKQCTYCHGPTGGGDGQMARYLDPRPRNFHRGEFKLASTSNGVPTDEDLLGVVKRGMLGSAMPSWSRFPEEDLRAVVAYVRHLTKEGMRKKLSEPDEDGDLLTVEQVQRAILARTTPGKKVEVAKESSRGRALFLENCATCHGEDGTGRERDDLVTSDDYPITPRDFTAGVFKGSSSPEALFVRIRVGMPGTPMPSFDLPDADVWEIIRYVRSLAGPPDIGDRPEEFMKRGEYLFRNLGCYVCHGEGGRGGIPNPNYIKDTVPALDTLADRFQLWEREDAQTFIQLIQEGRDLASMQDDPPIERFPIVVAQYQAIRDRIRHGSVPGKRVAEGPEPPLQMPTWGTSISDRDVDAIVVYLISQYPWEEEEDDEDEEEK